MNYRKVTFYLCNFGTERKSHFHNDILIESTVYGYTEKTTI